MERNQFRGLIVVRYQGSPDHSEDRGQHLDERDGDRTAVFLSHCLDDISYPCADYPGQDDDKDGSSGSPL